MNRKQRIGMGQEGFTLIEIISVLVLLGILTAIAVPKYLSLQQDASNQAAAAALAAGISNANQVFAKGLLEGTQYTGATLANALNNALYTTAGDYTLKYANGNVAGATCSITVTIAGVVATSAAKMPQGTYATKTAVIAQ
ncbi:MAG: prepilin-type N-terminal cleavage/methylation domain-containing protein [Syntrophobacteraceae bacterium]